MISEMNGQKISNVDEYREFIADSYDVWKDKPIHEMFSVFGKPKEYPFIAFWFVGEMDPYKSKDICKVYIAGKASVVSYYDGE